LQHAVALHQRNGAPTSCCISVLNYLGFFWDVDSADSCHNRSDAYDHPIENSHTHAAASAGVIVTIEMPSIRLARKDDSTRLSVLRMQLLAETGALQANCSEALLAATERYFIDSFDAGASVTWVGETSGEALVACGSLVFLNRLPYPGNLKGRQVRIPVLMDTQFGDEVRQFGADTAPKTSSSCG
jgi:hypothetical protein